MPHKGKIAAEEKIRIIESYLEGRTGWRSAHTSAGVGETTFRRWLGRYKTDGALGLFPQKQNRKYTIETKILAVTDYLSGQGSLQYISEKYGIRTPSVLAEWIKVYNSHGGFRKHTGGSAMTKSRSTTLEERIQIVKDCVAIGNDYGTTALKYQVAYQQVYLWVKKYRKMGEAGLEDRRGRRAGTLPSRTLEEELRDKIAELERKNSDLEMENALLKKVKELKRR